VPPYHATPEWAGQVVCAQLPRHVGNADDFKNRLRFEYNIEVSVDVFRNRPRVRISIQGYNTIDDVHVLLDALQRLI
jgi:isopenicillin-N epimerase